MSDPDDAPQSYRARFRARAEERGTYARWVLWAALAGMFATSFPITILSVSLSDIAVEFDTSASTLAWVISAPMLLSALSVPLLGKLGDLRGHRRVFLIGFTCSTIVSALTALAWDPLSLIGFRSLAQVIGSATQPTSMALMMLVFAPADRVKALGWWSMVAAGAPAIGLAVGGPLVDLVGWRMIFVVQAVFGAFAVALAAIVLPETPRRSVKFDVPGALTLSLAVGAGMFALGQAGRWGVLHPAVLASVAVVPIAAVAFVRIERRVEDPLLPLGLLRIRNVAFTLSTDFFQGAVYFGAFVLAPLALRDLYGLSATVASTVMILRTGMFAGASPVGGYLGARWGTLRTALLGTSVLAGAMVVFLVGTSTTSVVVFSVGLVVQGAGFGFARPPVTAALANAVPEAHLGLASALDRMCMQIGNSFGITLLTALYDDSGEASGFVPPFVAGLVLGIAAIITASFLQGGRPTRAQAAVPAAAAEVEVIPVD